jgi:integrase
MATAATAKLGGLAARFVKPATAAASDFVWTDTTYSSLQHKLKECGTKAGIVFLGFGWHTLRRTYATFRDMLDTAQMPAPALVRDMGHSNADMTSHYIRRDKDDVVAKLQELVFFCESFVQEKKPN